MNPAAVPVGHLRASVCIGLPEPVVHLGPAMDGSRKPSRAGLAGFNAQAFTPGLVGTDRVARTCVFVPGIHAATA